MLVSRAVIRKQTSKKRGILETASGIFPMIRLCSWKRYHTKRNNRQCAMRAIDRKHKPLKLALNEACYCPMRPFESAKATSLRSRSVMVPFPTDCDWRMKRSGTGGSATARTTLNEPCFERHQPRSFHPGLGKSGPFAEELFKEKFRGDPANLFNRLLYDADRRPHG